MALQSLGCGDTEFTYYFPSAMENLTLHATLPEELIGGDHQSLLKWLEGVGRDFVFEHSWLSDPQTQMEAECSVVAYDDPEAVMQGIVVIDDVKVGVSVSTFDEVDHKAMKWNTSYDFVATEGNIVMVQYGTDLDFDADEKDVITFGIRIDSIELAEETKYR